MTAKPEPAMYFSTVSEKQDYKLAMVQAGAIPATLNFGWYDAFTKLDGYSTKAFSDISFEDRRVAIEVKTPSDLASSFNDGRLAQFVWHAYLLKQIGIIQGFAITLRSFAEPIHEDATRTFLSAEEWLARNETRYGVQLLLARTVNEVPEVAKSFMREYFAPKPRTVPPPVIDAKLLEWPFGIQVLCMIPNIYIELAKQILSKVRFWSLFWDAHEMELEAFCDQYKQFRNFGGKKNVRLTDIWTAIHFDELFTETPVENVMPIYDATTYLKLHPR
jgi:hypothetical protein